MKKGREILLGSERFCSCYLWRLHADNVRSFDSLMKISWKTYNICALCRIRRLYLMNLFTAMFKPGNCGKFVHLIDNIRLVTSMFYQLHVTNGAMMVFNSWPFHFLIFLRTMLLLYRNSYSFFIVLLFIAMYQFLAEWERNLCLISSVPYFIRWATTSRCLFTAE